jgi:hypothetical protein
MPLGGVVHTFFLISLFQDLPDHDLINTPYLNYPGFQAKLVESDTVRWMIIEPVQIITHLVVYRLKSGTYGIIC